MKEDIPFVADQLSYAIRDAILEIVESSSDHGTHIGGAFSCADLLISIVEANYLKSKRTEEAIREAWPNLILSKGHSVLALFALNRIYNRLSGEVDLHKLGSQYLGHPTVNSTLNISHATGSLGMGLGIAVGEAIGSREKKGEDVYVILGDGEMNEGSVWEAMNIAQKERLTNLFVLVDFNGLQQTGSLSQISGVTADDLLARCQAFGWRTEILDGHNIPELMTFLMTKSRKPSIAIALTKKGKGIPEIENDNSWHHRVLTRETIKNFRGKLYESR